MSYETLAGFAQTFGLLWMMGFFLAVVALVYWPGRRARYDRIARSILPESQRESGE